jgi:hypothetical protein
MPSEAQHVIVEAEVIAQSELLMNHTDFDMQEDVQNDVEDPQVGD